MARFAGGWRAGVWGRKFESRYVDFYNLIMDVRGDVGVVCEKTHSLQLIGVALKLRARNPAEIKQLP